MKKYRYLFLVLFLSILMIPSGVFAESYDLDGTMSIDIDNSEWYVFTRNNIANNKELEELGVTYEYMDNFFKTNNAYVDAILFYENTLESIELVVRRNENSTIVNSKNYSDEDFKAAIRQNLTGFNPTNIEIYNTNGYKYAYAEYSDSVYKIAQYFVVINGHTYSIHIQKTGSLSAEDLTRFKEIIDSAKFKIDTSMKEKAGAGSNSGSDEGFFDSVLGKAVIGAIIGAAVGGISAVIMLVVKKKNKADNNTNNINMMNNGYNQNQYNNPNQYNSMNNPSNDFNNNMNYNNNSNMMGEPFNQNNNQNQYYNPGQYNNMNNPSNDFNNNMNNPSNDFNNNGNNNNGMF